MEWTGEGSILISVFSYLWNKGWQVCVYPDFLRVLCASSESQSISDERVVRKDLILL